MYLHRQADDIVGAVDEFSRKAISAGQPLLHNMMPFAPRARRAQVTPQFNFCTEADRRIAEPLPGGPAYAPGLIIEAFLIRLRRVVPAPGKPSQDRRKSACFLPQPPEGRDGDTLQRRQYRTRRAQPRDPLSADSVRTAGRSPGLEVPIRVVFDRVSQSQAGKQHAVRREAVFDPAKFNILGCIFHHPSRHARCVAGSVSGRKRVGIKLGKFSCYISHPEHTEPRLPDRRVEGGG